MEIKKVINHFRGYSEGSSRTFLTDDWRMRKLYMAGYGMWDVRDWPLDSNFVPAFEQCLALISSTQWTREVNKSEHATAISLIDNISASPIGNKRKLLPSYAVLECFAAWSDLRDQISSKMRVSVDKWFELNLSDIRQSYLGQLGQAVVELRRECEREHLKEARSLIERIERNILVQPWAFNPKDGAEFVALLEEVTSIVHEVRRLYRSRIDARIASIKDSMTNPRHLSKLADEELLSDSSSYFVIYTLGLKAEWENLEVWESQLRKIESVQSTIRPGDIEVSSNEIANMLFNCRSLVDFLARCPRISGNYSFMTASDKLYNLIGIAGDTTLRSKWDLVVEHFQRHEQSDPLVVNMMVHFCYGIAISGVHSADAECALDILISMLNDASSVLTDIGKCDISFAKSFLERQQSEGQEIDNLGVGEVFKYYAPASRSGSTSQSPLVLSANVDGESNNTGRHTNVTSLSAVIALFADAASATERLLGNESTRDHFAMFGFTPPPLAQNKSDHDVRSVYSVSLVDSDDEYSERGRRLRTLSSAVVGLGSINETRDFFEAHLAITHLENWNAIREAMDQEAEDICFEIRSRGRLLMSLAVRLGKRRLRCPEMIRWSIARRVYLRWALFSGEELDTGQKLGFIHSPNPKSERDRLQHRKDVENFRKYQREWGVRDLSYIDPLNSVRWTQDERDFASSRLE